AATTEESTPPDMAATTRVSRGGLGRPSELSTPARAGGAARTESDMISSPWGQGPGRQRSYTLWRVPPPERRLEVVQQAELRQLGERLGRGLVLHHQRVQLD